MKELSFDKTIFRFEESLNYLNKKTGIKLSTKEKIEYLCSIKDMAFDGKYAFYYLIEAQRQSEILGLDINKSSDFKMLMSKINGIEVINPHNESLDGILASTHHSDMDAFILSSVYDGKLSVVVKDEWKNHPQLRQFLEVHFDTVFGVDRNCDVSKIYVMKRILHYYKEKNGEKKLPIIWFVPGTIYDINNNNAENIYNGPFACAANANTKVIPIYFEQPRSHLIFDDIKTRIVIGKSIVPSRKTDYRQWWLEEVTKYRDSLEPKPLELELSKRHRFYKS